MSSIAGGGVTRPSPQLSSSTSSGDAVAYLSAVSGGHGCGSFLYGRHMLSGRTVMSGQLGSGPETLGQVSGRPGSGSVRSGPPLATGQLIRQWEISELRGHGLEQVIVDEGMEVEGLVHRLHGFPGGDSTTSRSFGPTGHFLAPLFDGIATGQINSFAEGLPTGSHGHATFVESERPFADQQTAAGFARRSRSAELEPDASLSFTITSAFSRRPSMTIPTSGCPPEITTTSRI